MSTTVEFTIGARQAEIVRDAKAILHAADIGRQAAARVLKAKEEAARPPAAEAPSQVGYCIAADRLRSIVERIERLEEERKALSSDIKDIFPEAKSAGFDVKVLRQLIRIRKQEPADVEEQETLLDVYRRALGM
jgi:uncharacterized protein (UPF0335 family)